MEQFQLNVNKILEKQFHVDFKGYSAIEVDEFLDMVIADYNKFDEVIEMFGNKINQLERINASLKAQVMELEGKAAMADQISEENVSQIDIVKRLAKLENEVYSKVR